MRQLFVQVPSGQGERVLDIARRHQGVNVVSLAGRSGEGAVDVVMAHFSNQVVERVMEALQELPDVRVTLLPHGIMALYPPPDEAPRQVVEVGHRSPLEVYLSGLQSVGSWSGFLSYAVASGILAWIGLYANTIYLLVAAMLVAPYASPAMNAAIATARGDLGLITRSLGRYLAALAVAMVVSVLLSWGLRQDVTTQLMKDVSELSAMSVLLPLVAGAAGALNVAQSERNSLVSGAAVGVLVAASLAPPAVLVGMSSVLGEWGMAQGALFTLALQLVGINLAGALVFRLFGLDAKGARYWRGRPPLTWALLLAVTAGLAGLLACQFARSPELTRTSEERRVEAAVQRWAQATKGVELVEVTARFTRADLPGQHTLLVVVYVQSARPGSEGAMSRSFESDLQRLLVRAFDVTPLVDVTVLRRPGAP